MSTSPGSALNKSIDLTQLPRWIDAHIGRLSAWALCVVCSMPVLVVLLSPWMEWDSRLWTLHLVTYGVGICSFAYMGVLLYWFWRNGKGQPWRERLRGRWMLVFFLAMLVWTILATVFSDNFRLCFIGDSLWKEGMLTQLAYAGLLTLGIKLAAKYRRRVLDCLVAAAAFQALLCFLDLPWVMELTEMARERAIYLNPNHYGYYLSITLPLAAGLLITEDFAALSPARRIVILALRSVELALLANSAILCRSLGPLGAIVIALVMLALLTGLTRKDRLLRSVLVVALCFAVMAASSPGVWDLGDDLARRATDMENVVEVIESPEADVTELDSFGSGRGVFWRQAVEYIGRHPIFGCGPDNIKAAYEEITGKFELVRPHSEPLQYAMTIGVPGLVFYLLALACLLAGFLKNFRRLELQTIMLYCAIGSYLVNSLVGNTKYYCTPYFFIIIGMTWAAVRALSEDKP